MKFASKYDRYIIIINSGNNRIQHRQGKKKKLIQQLKNLNLLV